MKVAVVGSGAAGLGALWVSLHNFHLVDSEGFITSFAL
jgi:predicted NAD/FAD-binding protein